MKIFTKVLLLTMVFYFNLSAQKITGKLNQLTNQTIYLEGFNGLKTDLISHTTIDTSGSFKLNYSLSDYGVGYLVSTDEKPFFVILSGEDIDIRGESLSDIESLHIQKGQENLWFEKYGQEHPKRKLAVNAWHYLEKIYKHDTLFSVHNETQQFIQEEKKRIKDEDDTFLERLPKNSYISWYLPMRKLVSSTSAVAQYYPDEIPTTIDAFRKIDYTDSLLYKSGLYKDAIESHFWLLENSRRPLDSVSIEMQISIDSMMEYLVNDEKKLNEVTEYLFDLLERHSLFQASQYLAMKVLNEENCTIDENFAKQLETYRTMKKGNIAPDILFDQNILAPTYKSGDAPERLSDLKSDYTVVVFGASWCPKCTGELPEIAQNYNKWKSQGVEVVFVSLDEDEASYKGFTGGFPFLSICDYQKWDSPVAQDYYVFATPTMYLLDRNRKILLRPTSVKQMDAWVDWYLVNEKK